MRTVKKKTLIPGYMQKFSCIGSTCEDTCCAGWQVNIDRKTYKTYKNLRDNKLTPLVEKHIKRVRTNASEHNYAQIIHTDDLTCPFLNKEKMCSFQLGYGEDYLSNTCNTYPRVPNIINGILEKSATLSCPEAARLALLNPEPMEFFEIEEETNLSTIISKQLQTDAISELNSARKYFWELRIFTIKVLQYRKYSLADRLVFLGVFYDKLQQIINDRQFDAIPQIISTFEGIFDTLQANIAEVPTSYELQLQLVKRLIDQRVLFGVNNNAYLECVEETLAGIHYKENIAMNELAQQYRNVYHSYFSPFLAKHEYILENYMVNYVFKNLFPFTIDANRVYDDYVLLILHFSMIKLHLIGMSGYHKDSFSIEHVIKAIYSFGRAVEHSPAYLYKLAEVLKQHDHSTLAHMAILIKN